MSGYKSHAMTTILYAAQKKRLRPWLFELLVTWAAGWYRNVSDSNPWCLFTDWQCKQGAFISTI